MKRLVHRTFAALVLILGLVACGGDDEADDDTAPDASAGAPSVTASSNATSVLAGGQLTLTVSVTNFALVDPATNTVNVDGHGHYHVYLDDATGASYLAATSEATTPVTIPASTAAGLHTLKVQLFNNDHSALSPEVSDTIEFTVTTSTFAGVTATPDTTTPSPGDTVTLTIAVENFTLQAAGGTNAVGYGHYHVYFDTTSSTYLAADYETTVGVAIPDSASAGAHTLIVELHNNDHSVVAPTVQDIVNLTVQ